tara:strand:- start:259 stop:1053 length:795 start_codon:yes stop_codon:yes gene_type:complete
MSNFTDFIGGGGGGTFPTIFLHNSQTWVPPQDGNIMIHVIGAGGSGSGTTSTVQIESGAAGGYCRKNSLAVTTSGSFTVTIGAGGASVIGAVGAGTDGGVTTMAGTGLSLLRSFGGAGGALSNNTYTTGGVATGGDVNYTGGRGGNQKGGGAVGLSGTGIDGGGASSSSFGGRCDILGDFYSSSLGQLSGSSGGKGMYISTGSAAGESEAGPLAGAGSMLVVNSTSVVGHASIGGGGGWGYGNNTARIHSGRGGEGCVVIQYIP